MYLLKIVWYSNFPSAIALFWKKMVYFMTFNLFVMNCTIFVISTLTRYNVQLSWRSGKSARKQRPGPIVYNFILICCEWNKRLVVYGIFSHSRTAQVLTFYCFTRRAHPGNSRQRKIAYWIFPSIEKIVLLGFLPDTLADTCLVHGEAQCV